MDRTLLKSLLRMLADLQVCIKNAQPATMLKTVLNNIFLPILFLVVNNIDQTYICADCVKSKQSVHN